MTQTLLARFLREKDGQDLIEYVLIAALISVISVLAMTSVGDATTLRYDASATAVAGS